MTKYKVLKEFIYGMQTYQAKGSIFEPVSIDDEFKESLLRHSFIEPIEENTRWRAGDGQSEYWYIGVSPFISAHTRNDYGSGISDSSYESGNYFKSKETADKVKEALKYVFEYFHHTEEGYGTFAADMDEALREARDAVLADDRGEE